MMNPLQDWEKANFDTLGQVFDDGADALLRTVLVEDIPAGTEVAVVAGIATDGQEYGVTPIAMLFPGNPYEMLVDPTSEEGETAHA